MLDFRRSASRKLPGVNVVYRTERHRGAEVEYAYRSWRYFHYSVYYTYLYVIDGFQSEDGLKNIDVNDIKTIDILKDASWTTAIMERVEWCGSLLRPKSEVVARQP